MSRITKERRSRLSASLVRQLGSVPDEILAAKFKVPVQRLRLERALRGIPWGGGRLAWNEKQVKLLGTAPDETVARKLGVTKSSITQKRKMLGVAPYGRSRQQNSHPWKKLELRWLGKITDKEVAKRIGISSPSVGWKRRTLGIAARKSGGRSTKPRNKSELALLGKLPDTVVARRLGIHRHQVAMLRAKYRVPVLRSKLAIALDSPTILKRLANEPAKSIAAELRVSVFTLNAWKHRNRQRDKNSANRKGSRKPRFIWNRAAVTRLGNESDGILAREFGVSRQTILSQRRRLGIESYSSKQVGQAGE